MRNFIEQVTGKQSKWAKPKERDTQTIPFTLISLLVIVWHRPDTNFEISCHNDCLYGNITIKEEGDKHRSENDYQGF